MAIDSATEGISLEDEDEAVQLIEMFILKYTFIMQLSFTS